jgi:gliding motility-associated-like protein
MKILRYIFPVFFSLSGISSLAQYTFVADTVSGCDSLRVTFEFRSTALVDTVTSVEWDFGNGLTASGREDQEVMYDEAGSYTVSISVNGVAMEPKPGFINVHATPNARFLWADSLELGSYSVVFLAAPQPADTVDYIYQWLFSDGGTGNTRALIHRFPESGEYMASLRVTHPGGCMDQRSRALAVRDSLDCPNVFTPNDDGINDLFIVNSNGVTIYNLQVFSRSGILVYKAEAPILIWDGRNLSGQQLLPGTYYYIIREAGRSGGLEKKGFVNLYR